MFARLMQYIFFLRFPILLWIALGAFGFVDAYSTTAVTRVLLTMRNEWQLLYVTFFVVLAGWQALMLARLVCAYGGARFNSPPPDCWVIRRGKLKWSVFLLPQAPGFVLLVFVYMRSSDELTWGGVSQYKRYGFILLGVLFAFMFWYVLAWFYAYLHPKVAQGEMHAFLFPTRSGWFGRGIQDAGLRDPGRITVWLQAGFSRIAGFLGPGFVESGGSEAILPGQYFAILLLIGLILLHLTLAFITYPLPRGTFDTVYMDSMRVRYISPGLTSIGLSAVLFIVATYCSSRKRYGLWRLCMGATLVCLICWVLVAREADFPALATILILISAGLSLLAGSAFVLDRYRVPALVPIVVVLLLLHHWAEPDHIFYPEIAAQPAPALKSPELFLKELYKGRPLMVITATGGGIHAARWTSLVLAHLEEAFHEEGVGNGGFHGNILLLSSASGGSVAVANWMREYVPGGYFSSAPCLRCSIVKPFPDRLENAAATPSVEAIAWGLLHYDLYQVLFPFARNYQDRGWFLEQSLLLNHYLNTSADDALRDPVLPLGHDLSNAKWNESPTLGEFAASGAAPAFTLNATDTESGERYVLGNYELKQSTPCADDGTVPVPIAPYVSAESFLSAFPGYDLSLMTAARLSATFPYVSPTSRPEFGSKIPTGKLPKEDHLADGGYYDNDGIASAAEFLWLALGGTDGSNCQNAASGTGRVGGAKAAKNINPCKLTCAASKDEPVLPKTSLPVIWIVQIRDSPLPIPPGPVGPNYKPSACGPLCELTAPLTTLYQSGHIADPERNQRDLAVLERAVAGRAILKTMVFAYQPPQEPKQAEKDSDLNREEIRSQEENWTTLNWLLSRADTRNIDRRWAELSNSAKAFAAAFKAQALVSAKPSH